jgi:hypothetical protein
MVTKMLVTSAIALSLLGVAPADADPDASATNNPYSGLTCNCQQAATQNGPADIDRGLRAARSH